MIYLSETDIRVILNILCLCSEANAQCPRVVLGSSHHQAVQQPASNLRQQWWSQPQLIRPQHQSLPAASTVLAAQAVHTGRKFAIQSFAGIFFQAFVFVSM